MFIGVSLETPELNVARVALRVSEGGHDVPKDRIVARYERTMRLMPQAIMIADRSLIFDNSDSFSGPLLVFTTEWAPISPDRQMLLYHPLHPQAGRRPAWVDRFILAPLLDAGRENGHRVMHGSHL